MTTPDDTTLMAYVDGELDAATRTRVQAAIEADPALAQRVQRLSALRPRLQAAFEPDLDEPVPDRLLRALDAASVPVRTAANDSRWGWAQWGGMAASLLLGVALARLWPAADGAAVQFAQRADGRVVARGEIARALSTALAAEPGAAAPLAVQLSFVDRDGAYCRTFTLPRTAGLACRDGDQWVVETLADAAPASPAGTGTMRPAAAALPEAVLDAVDRRIAGTALDAPAERAARDRAWQR